MEPIAVLGIGCRFPGGVDTPDALWALVRSGVDAVTDIPADRFDAGELFDPDPGAPGAMYVRRGGFLSGIDLFDADFFGIAPREARRMDPQHRLLLEVAWEALEDGGIAPERLAGTAAGVFVGISSHDYADIATGPGRRHLIDAYANAGGALSMAANRISYHLDLRGPSIAVDTACSSGLTAVHLACRSLALGESEVAIAGGVNLILAPEPIIGFCKAGMLSPDGRSMPFDARANGYARGEGAGALVLKTLARAQRDGDPVRAVIRGTAANQDGRTAGISVPDPEAQAALIRDALAAAGMDPGDIGYVEAHGTGTPVGDPVEAAAIGAALGGGRVAGRPCLVGSVKANLGHLEAAAGIAGLAKAVLALEHREVPPTIHVTDPNPAIPFAELGLRVPTVPEPWPPGPGRPAAGVNSFGFGGANAHVVVEAAPEPPPAAPDADDGRAHVVVLSARAPEALGAAAAAWARMLDAPGAPALVDLARTAALRRGRHRHRVAAVAASREELAGMLASHAAGGSAPGLHAGSAPREEPRLAFVFSGMGPQWWGMGRGLMAQEPIFAEAMRECDRALAPLAGWSLIDELGAGEQESRVADARVAHAANAALQIALAALWRSWGVVPDAVVGHSSGEAGAACVAGALPVAEALRVAFHRGRLQALTAGRGGMLATGLTPERAHRVAAGTDGRVCVAALNGPASVTLSGDAAALAAVALGLEAEGVFARAVPVDIPYHGREMDAIRDRLLRALDGTAGRPPAIPMVSTVTGERIDGRPIDAAYWWRNVREPVRFADAIGRLAEDGVTLFVELSPHPVLATSVRECLAAAGREGAVLAGLRRGADDRRAMLGALAELHVRGRAVRWEGVVGEGGRHVRLPPYPWRRERHWMEPAPADGPAPGAGGGHPLLGRRLRGPRAAWECELGDPRLAYLQDHVVEDVAAFPAAAYVEMCLAAARALAPEGPLALERVELLRMLQTPDPEAWLVQCVHDPASSRLEVHAARRGPGPAWTLHAAARVGAPGAHDRRAEDLAALRARCPRRQPVATLLRRADAAHGLRYGPAFRGLAGLWCGEGEALGRVEAPASLGPLGGHQVHPALLDAALQALVGAVGAGPGGVAAGGSIVPVGIGSVALSAPPGAAFWTHVTVAPAGPREWTARVALLDDAGVPALVCEDVRLRGLGGRRRPADAWVYAEEWEPVQAPPRRARGGLPPPAALVATARGAPAVAAADARVDAYYAEVEPALNRLAGRYARAAGVGDGALAVAPRHARLVERLAAAAALEGTDGDPGEILGPLRAGHPDHGPLIELVRHSGEHLARTLTGEEDATRWLFSGAPWEALVAGYAEPPPFRRVNRAVAEVVAAAAAGRREGRRLRVLEVGAGTGGTTVHVLDRLAGSPVDYVMTDVSPLLVRRAREAMGAREGLDFAVLDVEDDADPGLGSFDVVVAANLVHGMPDVVAALRRLGVLLAPGGVLVVQEAVRRSPWADLVFGQLEGWWRAEDRDLRPSHPLLGTGEWTAALGAAGYAEAEVLAEAPVDGGPPAQAVMVAAAPRAVAVGERAPGRRWLLLADAGGVAAALADALRAHGDEPLLVAPGAPVDLPRMLAGLSTGPLAPGGILHLRALDAPAEPDGADDLMEAAAAACDDVVALARTLGGMQAPPPELWLVTAGGQGPGAAHALGQAPLWGIGRALRNEHLGARCRLVDVGVGARPSDVAVLAALVTEGDPDGGDEPELAVRDGALLARRVRRAPLERPPGRATAADPDEDAFRLEIDTPGDLSSLVLRAGGSRAPGPREVAIRVEAAPLNFKDVLLAMGMLGAPGDGAPPLGLECAGVVTDCGPAVDGVRPGDRVVAIAPHALGSRVVARSELVAPLPRGLDAVEAAGSFGGYATAVRALEDLAGVRPGERVLIHSGAGGVGLAAVRVALRAGAEVLATAGTQERRDHLRSIGVAHALDSRTLAWADDVMRLTGGEGVNVVLNSLAGEALARGVAMLRPFGRFVEIGKRDLVRNAPLGLEPFARSLSFLSLHLDQLSEERPREMGALMRRVARDLGDGALEPLPHTVFDLAEAEAAFRTMAQARHIGRIVIGVGEPGYAVAPARRATPYRADATYLLAGGLGGLGISMAAHMARGGARHLVLTSRGGRAAREDAAALEALRAREGVEVLTASCDVTDRAQLESLLARVRASMPPLRGVVHAAAVLEDGLLAESGPERIRTVLAPKVAGGWNLHAATRDDPLDLFVLLSSFSSVLGPPGQGPYAAANAFLDALAGHRRARGLPALAVNLGAFEGVGMVERSPQVRDYLERLGLLGMPPDAVWELVDEMRRAGTDRRMLALFDWASWSDGPAAALRASVFAPLSHLAGGSGPPDGPSAEGIRARIEAAAPGERAGLVEDHVARIVAGVLDTTPERVERDVPLSRMGLDSLMAVELMTALQQDLGVAAPLGDLLRGMALGDLVALARWPGAGGGRDAAAPATGALSG